MKNKTSPPVIQVGISSLAVVFVVLCLVIFAALSLISASDDLGESRRSAQRRTEYYDACNRVEAVLDELDSRAAERGKAAVFDDLGIEKRGSLLSFRTELNDTQTILVELILTPEGKENYRLLTYKIITSAASGEEEPLKLMPMGG